MGWNILLVDDEEIMLKYLSKRLELRGCRVTTASTGEEALEVFENARFDLVLLDVLMPGMGGIETLKALKRKAPDCPVILVTGKSSGSVGKEAKEWGAADIVKKPFDLELLMDKIKHFLPHS